MNTHTHTHTHTHIYIYIYIYIKRERERIEKQSNPKLMNLLWRQVDVKTFDEPSSGL